MDSQQAYAHKIALFRKIKNSVFIDPDTSLWFIAYLLDQNFSIKQIAEIQKNLNDIMLSQIDGNINNDDHPGFNNLKKILSSREVFSEFKKWSPR